MRPLAAGKEKKAGRKGGPHRADVSTPVDHQRVSWARPRHALVHAALQVALTEVAAFAIVHAVCAHAPHVVHHDLLALAWEGERKWAEGGREGGAKAREKHGVSRLARHARSILALSRPRTIVVQRERPAVGRCDAERRVVWRASE